MYAPHRCKTARVCALGGSRGRGWVSFGSINSNGWAISGSSSHSCSCISGHLRLVPPISHSHDQIQDFKKGCVGAMGAIAGMIAFPYALLPFLLWEVDCTMGATVEDFFF